ncbi:MAG TPA: hypothetical protein VE890_14160, partial [Thermoguttaceae bacterium]|nr:hypothetical protein [Thermoguttaceae bacterium]
MTKLRILAVVGLVFAIGAYEAMAQRRGGGMVQGGMRGAVAGGLLGGSSGAATGAKVGAVVGTARGTATRMQERSQYQHAMDMETQSRMQFEASPEYQTLERS